MFVYLGLGTNLGDRKENLRIVRKNLAEIMRIHQESHVFESAAMYHTEQPRFLNMVLLAETTLNPIPLLQNCKDIEARMGRDAATSGHRYGPRTIDIDILLAFTRNPLLASPGKRESIDDSPGIDKITIHQPNLTIPHPLLTERAFVLLPLLQCLPTLTLPDIGEALSAFLPLVAEQDCRDIGQLDTPPNNAYVPHENA